nr:hypothetical protein StreXyl84_45440 [Streptomyces sp. Xyl84]
MSFRGTAKACGAVRAVDGIDLDTVRGETLGSVPFTLLGLGNGYGLTPRTTAVANLVCDLGLAALGGLWFPAGLFPHWLRSVSAYTPTSRFAQLGVAVTEGHTPAAGAVLVLTGRLVAFGSYAVLSYRRNAGTV